MESCERREERGGLEGEAAESDVSVVAGHSGCPKRRAPVMRTFATALDHARGCEGTAGDPGLGGCGREGHSGGHGIE